MLKIRLPEVHDGQREIIQSSARFKVLSCGRRWGKTALGTLMCYKEAADFGNAWWVAPTYKMANVGWRMMEFFGSKIPGAKISRSEKAITLPGGGRIQVRSADDPNSLRGDGLTFLVMDECAYIREIAWTEALRPALADRKGRALFISTPRGLNWFRDIYMQGLDNEVFPQWKSWTFKTTDNPFIDPEEIEAAKRTLSSRVFRQEFEADFLADNPGALWKREWIDDGRVFTKPEDFDTIIVSVDPNVTSGGDDCGIVVCAKKKDKFYVLEDLTTEASPAKWGNIAFAAYSRWEADYIVAEKNNGGDMVEITIKQQPEAKDIPVKLIHASRGKQVRAHPVSALYENKLAHHIGFFQELEDELCQWEPGQSSPNRLDAMVHGATDLCLSNAVIKEVKRIW